MASSKAKWKRTALCLPPLILILLADRISKRWAADVLSPQGPVSAIPGVLGWRYAENTGVAFSAFSGAGAIVCVFTGLIIAAAAVWLMRHPACGGWTGSGLTLIIAGGLGNLYDRVRFGYVIDFIELLFVRFAIFNAADIAVVSGAVCLAIGILKTEGKARDPVSH